jgi:hypothetical protein
MVRGRFTRQTIVLCIGSEQGGAKAGGGAYSHTGETRSLHAQRPRRGLGEVDNASGDIGTAIDNRDHQASSVAQVHDLNTASQRKGAMCRRLQCGIEDRAAGRRVSGFSLPIPRRHTDLFGLQHQAWHGWQGIGRAGSDAKCGVQNKQGNLGAALHRATKYAVRHKNSMWFSHAKDKTRLSRETRLHGSCAKSIWKFYAVRAYPSRP